MTNGHQDPERPRSRLESELLEILQRTDQPPSNVIKFRSGVRGRRYRAQERLGNARDISAEPIVLLIACLALAAVGAFLPSSLDLIAHVLGWIALALFVVLYVTGYRASKRGTQVKRWRGKDIDLRPPSRFR